MVLEKFKAYCEKYGFMTDGDLSELNRILKHNHFKRLHIDIYIDKPYMLLLRTAENDAKAVVENGRIIIRSGDKNKTTIMNILKSNIEDCIVKRFDNTRYEILISVNGVCYKIFALI